MTTTVNSQNYEIRKLTERNPLFPEQVYTFPILLGSNHKIVNNINSYLIEEQLRLEYGQEKNSIFENVWQTQDQPMSSIYDLDYTLELLNSKMYSVTINGEFCNAYCEQYSMTYNFNLETGKILQLNSLFTKQGQKKLINKLSDKKRDIINQKLKDLESILNAGTISSADNEYYGEMYDLYKNCLKYSIELEYLNFFPKNQKLQLSQGRCSNHANRNIDELNKFQFEIDLKKWEKSLSELGRKILM